MYHIKFVEYIKPAQMWMLCSFKSSFCIDETALSNRGN